MNITPKLLQRTTKTPIKKVNFIKSTDFFGFPLKTIEFCKFL